MGATHESRQVKRGAEDNARDAHSGFSLGLLPVVMRSEHVAAVLGLKSASAARRRMKTGALGRVVPLGKRIYILRDEFLAALTAAQEDPATRQPPDRAHHLRRGPQTGTAQLTT